MRVYGLCYQNRIVGYRIKIGSSLFDIRAEKPFFLSQSGVKDMLVDSSGRGITDLNDTVPEEELTGVLASMFLEGCNLYEETVLKGYLAQVEQFKQRDCYKECEAWLRGHDTSLVLYGLRRTGKTVLLFQMIAELIRSGVSYDDVVYMSIRRDNTLDFYKLEFVLQRLFDYGVRYIFVDEVTYIKDSFDFLKDFMDSHPGCNIVFSGTFSFQFRLASKGGCFGRFIRIDTTYLSFAEYSKLYSGNVGVDDYIMDGGLPRGSKLYGVTNQVDIEKYRSISLDYINSSVVQNLVHSLFYVNSDEYASLVSGVRRNAGEIEWLVRKWVQLFQLDFAVACAREFVLDDVRGASKNLYRRIGDSSVVDVGLQVESEYKKSLGCLLAGKSEKQLVSELKQFLLDTGCACETSVGMMMIPLELRVCVVAEVLLRLKNMGVFDSLGKEVINRMKGVLLEGQVHVELYKHSLYPKKYRNNRTGAEIDVVLDSQKALYEVKHSDKLHDNQYRWLKSKEVLENYPGYSLNILYSGENAVKSVECEDGMIREVHWYNVSDFLRAL